MLFHAGGMNHPLVDKYRFQGLLADPLSFREESLCSFQPWEIECRRCVARLNQEERNLTLSVSSVNPHSQL
jgi:hypothetical protein